MLVAAAVVTPRTSVQADKAYVEPASSITARQQRVSLFLCMANPVRVNPDQATTGAPSIARQAATSESWAGMGRSVIAA